MNDQEVDLALKNSLFILTRKINKVTGLWPFLPQKEKNIKLICYLTFMLLAIKLQVSKNIAQKLESKKYSVF